MQCVKILNHEGKYKNWNITHEDERGFFEIEYGGLITAVDIKKCYYIGNELYYSNIVRSKTYEEEITQSTGTEECCVCGRSVRSYSRLKVGENSDLYYCIKCAKSVKKLVKSAIN